MTHMPPESGGRFQISSWAIRNPVPVTILFIAMVLAGVISYGGLPVKLFPNVQFPVVTITVTQNGAAPSEMETQITRPIEDAVAGLADVKDVSSTVSQGVSTTAIQFELGHDLQKKADDVRARIDQTRAILPREIDEPTVTKLEIDSQPILTYAVEADGMTDADLSWFIDDTLSRAMQSAKGVSQITRVGGVNREINVIVDADKLAARGLTAAAVNNALRGFSVDAAGGRASVGGREQTLRVLGAVNTLGALREMTIPAGQGRYIKLTDVAQVGDGASETRGFARYNNRPVVGFQVMKTRDSSDVKVDDGVIKALAELQKVHPEVKFVRIFSSVDATRETFEATKHVLLEGMILAALVVLIFLGDWRSTMITAFAMPVSLIPTFFIMKWFDFSLNQVTLLALTLVVGILVDDAIVEIENIEKRVAQGMRPYDASLLGADAIGLAVVATTMAIVVVFMPVAFMKGIPGQFFREFGITVSVAVVFSLVVARLLTPLMAAYLLRPSRKPHPRKPFTGFYRNALEWALDHRIIAAFVGGLLFVGSMALVPLLPRGFQPIGDPDYLYVTLQGPPGATASDMELSAKRVADVYLGNKAVKGVFTQIGSTVSTFGPGSRGGGGSDLRSGTIIVLLHEDRTVSGADLKAQTRPALRAIPDVRATFLDVQSGGGIQQVLTSNNPDALAAASLELEKQMRTIPLISNPHPSSPPTAPELVIRPRSADASRLGVSVEAIAQVARIATVGDIDANVAKLTAGERRIPIRIRLPVDARSDLQRIKSLRVPMAAGGLTTLDAVADVSFQAGPGRIERLNRQRQQTITAELNGAVQGPAFKAIQNLPIMKHLPPGVTPAATGTLEAMQELFGSFGLALIAGIGMIFGVLVLLFRSFFKPIIILSALPTAVGGAFLGLLAFNLALSVPSLIGFLMLMGIAAKNSILLVEYAIEREREGMSQREALLEACRERARPIVMTTMAMAAGMLPTAFALEKGAEFRQPMAVAVIGGLMTSTILSLVLVPVVYEFVDDFENWLKPRLARLITPRYAPDSNGDQPN